MGKTAKRWLIGIGVFFLVILAWGLIEPYFIDVEEEEGSITNLPENWEGEEIAVIGDFQVGMWFDNTATIERIVEDLVEIQPRAVLLTGDYIYHAASDKENEIETITALLSPLTENDIPVFGVLGNHDYAAGTSPGDPDEEMAQEIFTSLEEIGVVMLRNEAAVIPFGENGQADLYVVGIGSLWGGNVDLEAAFETVPDSAPRIVLMHNPDVFNEIETGIASLAIAGHTHGGQIRVPFTEDWSYLALVQPDEVQADGWIDDYGDAVNQLYVNRGIGFSILPMRINCPPEITMFTLTGE